MRPRVSAETPHAIAYGVSACGLAALKLWILRNKTPSTQVKAKRENLSPRQSPSPALGSPSRGACLAPCLLTQDVARITSLPGTLHITSKSPFRAAVRSGKGLFGSLGDQGDQGACGIRTARWGAGRCAPDCLTGPVRQSPACPRTARSAPARSRPPRRAPSQRRRRGRRRGSGRRSGHPWR
jgi:hypothetical protein